MLYQHTARTRVFVIQEIIGASDGVFVGFDGLDLTLKISKDGSAFADPFAGATSLTEISDGAYKVDLAPEDTDTLGDLAFLISGDIAGHIVVDQVVPALPGELTIQMLNAIADRVLTRGDGIELGLNLRDAIATQFAVMAGKSSVVEGVVRFRNFGDTKDRATFTLGTGGIRVTATYDFS